MKTIQVVLLSTTACLLTGCTTSRITGVIPTAPPAELIAPAWKPSWSPDGRRLVYGKTRGTGLDILDLSNRRIAPLAPDGKDPVWSPDGQWIAFIREESFNQYFTEEVWIMPAQGGTSRKIIRGGFPSWSTDGRHLYVHSRQDRHIRKVDPFESPVSATIFYTNAPAWYFSVSPDETRVAFGCSGGLDIRDCTTGQRAAFWPTPRERGLLPAWSPDGRLVAFGGYDESQLGLWVFDVQTHQAACVMKGAFTMPSWSWDGRWIAFDNRRDPRSVWMVGRQFGESLLKTTTTLASEPGGHR